MKPVLNETLDAKKLMQFYKDHGFCISYRQLREWIRAGILNPQGWGSKRKVFPPAEVAWTGLAFILRMSGKKLSSIKELRVAVASDSTRRKSQARHRKHDLFALLQRQQQTIQSLADTVGSTGYQKVIVPDHVTIKGNEVIATEYKNATKTSREKELQMKSYQETLKSKLRGKKVKCAVKTIREKRGMSQTELATILGFSQARLSQIENGWREPDDIQKATMAGVLKEKIGTLFPA